MLANASPLEVGWTMMAFFGLVPTTMLLKRAVCLELRRHRSGVNGALEASLHKDIVLATVLLVVTSCFFVAGLVAMQAPPNPLASVDAAAALPPVLTPILFMLANGAATFGSGYYLLQQQHMDAEIGEAARRDRRAGDKP